MNDAQTIDITGASTKFLGLKSGISGSAIYSVDSAVTYTIDQVTFDCMKENFDHGTLYT